MRLSSALRRAALVAACLLGGSLQDAIADPVGDAGAWRVVLVAGDDSAPVFDNAVESLAGRLARNGTSPDRVRRLTAAPALAHDGVELATKRAVLGRIAAIGAQSGERCLVFMTSHGTHDGGLWLARSDQVIRPRELASALDRGCPGLPAVVIVSSCFSGAFARGRLVSPNHVILTAARADRASFGCQADRIYTFYDECLLGALPGAAGWQAVFGLVRGCVERKEQTLDAGRSEPQAFFGRAVAALGTGLSLP